MGLVHRQARIPISGFGCPKMHAMVGVSLSCEMPLGSEMPSHAKFIFYNVRTGCGCTKKIIIS